jgi:hypothetical protein
MKLCCCGCCGVDGWNGGAFGLNENGAAWISAGCWFCGGGLCWLKCGGIDGLC